LALSTSDKKTVGLFERKMLRSIYGPMNHNRCSYELQTLYKDMDFRTYIKVGELKWMLMSKWTGSDLRKEFLLPSQKAEVKK
jgi:hypothetical protein